MSEKPTTKSLEAQSSLLCERAADRHMILNIMTKIGAFEFAFSPDLWRRLGESAKWFEKRPAELEVELVEDEKKEET